MIHMPHRSVTRFFIPLIDVLLLLFVIFLLMPIASEEELQGRRDKVADLSVEVDVLERELEGRLADLQKYESLRAELLEIDRLKQDLERLKQLQQKGLRQTQVHVLDVDGKTGEISYYDAARLPDQARIPINDEVAARNLQEKHRREAGQREIYYYFLMPRPVTGFPSLVQVRRYRQWFSKNPNSLPEDGVK